MDNKSRLLRNRLNEGNPNVQVLLLMTLLSQGPVDRYAVLYSDAAEPSALAAYQLLVLDSAVHPPLDPLKDREITLLGYLSLGEVEQYRPHYADVRAEGILLQENANWPGSFMVDLRDQRWTKRVLEELIPQILFKGFDGIFVDTMDNPFYLESLDPQANKGMGDAAVDLIRAIRRHFPDMPLMLNRGYPILDALPDQIHMIMAESLYTDYDFKKKKPGKADPAVYLQTVDRLRRAKVLNPKLKVYSLDYWDPKDSVGVREIYRIQRANGFIPYVSELQLNRLIPEP